MVFGESDPLGKQAEAEHAASQAASEADAAKWALRKRIRGVVDHHHPITSAFEFMLILLALLGVAIAALIWQAFFGPDTQEVAVASVDDRKPREPSSRQDPGSPTDDSPPPAAAVDVSGTYAVSVQYAGGASLPDPQFCDPLLTDTVVFDHKGKILELTVNGISLTGSISDRLKFDLSASAEDITFTLTGDFFPQKAGPTEVKGTQTHSLQRRTCIYSFRGTKSS